MFFQKFQHGHAAVLQDPVSAAIGIGGSLIGASATKSAAKTSAAASDRAAQVQWDMYNQTREDQTPWRDVGQGALFQLADLYGLPRPGITIDGGNGQVIQQGQTTNQPAQVDNVAALIGQYFDQKNAYDNRVITSDTDPAFPSLSSWLQNQNIQATAPVSDTGTPVPSTPAPTTQERQQNAMAGFFQSPDYQFRLNEGQKAIERSAAARGGVLSGATQKGLIDYAGNLASGEYNNYVNRLASLAGVGQTANQSISAAGMQAAAGAGAAYQNAGNARASGYLGQANTINNALNNYQLMNAIGGNSTATPGFFGGQNPLSTLAGSTYNTNPFSQQSAMLAQQDFGF